MARQTLIFDADDTLWVNTPLFEQTIEDFFDWLAHPTLDRRSLRHLLDEIEAADTEAHGFGSRVFLRSLARCVHRVRDRPATTNEEAEIQALGARLLEHKMELMPEVSQVLGTLGGRHDLRLMTKGDPDEQLGKLDASGLAHHFLSVHVVRHKDDATYRQLISHVGLDVSVTWMIGNSPRSDILPARRVGMRAVHIPDENPWVLEQAELDPDDPGVVRLASFVDLTAHF